MGKEITISIPKTRAEYPFLIVGAFLIFVGWAIHYGFFGWQGGFVWLGILLPIATYIYLKRRGAYFVQANAEGISWRKDLLSNYIFLPWKFLHRVDYLVFEINFQVKETGQVVSFPTSGLTEPQTDELKQYISDIVKSKLEKGEL